MKSPFIIFLVFFCTNLITGQVKIGDNPQTLDPTSLLELESNSKVLVISRMSEAEILGLSPLQGAMVYNTDASCIFYYDGTNWNNLCDGGGTGSIAWGDITGDLDIQEDLFLKFQNYVDLATAQTITGEKTLTNKLTVNTGNIADQAAEFFGRVKGEAGTADEDFVTKAQLDAVGGGGTWVDLTTAQSIAGEKTLTDKFTVDTGTMGDQVAEFFGRVKGEAGTADEDFVTKAQLDAAGGGGTWVDLTTAQSIAGEKTLTDKFTVDTGTTGDQVAEFFGRVKGENGTEVEDFVTKLQMDAVIATGASGTPGSVFFAGTDTGLTENNGQLFWDNSMNQLRVGDHPSANSANGTNNSTLNIKGSVSKPIVFGVTGLNEAHHTTIIDADAAIFLPPASTCVGRMYVIKVRPGRTITIFGGYLNTDSVVTTAVDDKVLHLQSNGFQWEQIN